MDCLRSDAAAAPLQPATSETAAPSARLHADGAPEGLLAHVCFGSSGNLRVSEVWESREQQEQFAQHLMPVLQAEGVDVSAEPEILDVEGYFMRDASSQASD